MGYSPASFQGASLRQVYAVARAYRDKMRYDWEHTLMVYTKIHNVNATKSSQIIHPDKLIKDMFGRKDVPVKPMDLLDKFRMLALETGGVDHRKRKG